MEEFRIVLADACKIVKGSSRKHVISGADEDGRVMVEFSEPVGGRRVKMLTPDEINGILYKEETSESPANAEEAMAEETEPPTAGQEENGESALERIPKDAQTGEPQYTQTDAPTAWDAIVEQTEGDEDMARSVVDSTVRDKEAALKKLESSNPKPGATVAEKIAAAKEHKAAIEAARQELEQWKAIAEVENSRKAEEETKAEAERKAKANAEEERTALKGVNLSEEKDENGNSFVVSSDGTTTFGEVRDKSGLPAAPIKLSVGYQDKNGSGYGLTHIEANHGAQIKKEGFASVEDFVSYVAKNYDENNIKVGKRRTGGSITYLLQVTGKHDNTLFIELSRDGSYWNVNSAGVFRKGYSDKKETVAKTEPQQPSNAISERALQSADQSNGILPASPNGKPTVSASKVSESSETKQEKAEKSISAKVKEASADVNTEPTEAQKEAGNYKKGHVQVGTFDITIEQPEGSIRRGTDADGKQWESKMHNTYGYFRGTEGVDGDHIDVFLSNDMDGWNGAQVFVVDQYNPDGTFDEHKVMLGFNDADEAKGDYLANYKKGWEKGRRIDVSAVNLEDFEKWIASSHRKTKPFSEYSSVNKETVANTPAEEEAKADAAEEAKAKVKEASADEMQNIEAEIKHLEEIKDYPGADKKLVQSEIDRLKAEKEAKAKSKSEEVKSKSKEENGVDDAKIDAALEALDKGREKAARRLASKLTNKELSKARGKAKPSFLLEYEWQWRAQNRGDVSLHDWMLENQYVEPVKRVSGTFRITDYTAPKDSPYAERLGGVYHDKSGFAVATDARILVASKDDFDPKLKGKVIGKDGTVSESKFPDWQKVVLSVKETKPSRIDVEDLRKFVAGVLRANKRAYISLRFPDGTVEVFKANRLNLMLRAMKQLGTSELLYTKDGMKLVAKSEKGTALLMGLVSVEDELVEANGYAYPGNTVSYQRGEVVGEMSPEERVLRDAVIDRLRESGMEVITDEEAGQRVLDEANGKAKLSAKKRRALETASLGKTPRSLTVVSSAGGAKVLKSIDVLASEFEKSVVQPKTFIGDVAKALGAKRGGSASEYASFETKNGKIITIRLSNHNAKVSNFDANGEADGISIVVSPKKSEGMTNDGKAHVVEYYYDAIKLRRAEGKPLADIVRSIKQALYSGEFEDTTGLAERQEVNADDVVKFQRVYHGSGADFDRFDHSHMGEGEGAQAYGWGTYVTEVEGIGRTYAIQNTTKHNDALRALQHDVDAISDQLYRQRDDLNDDEEQLKRANEWRAEAELDYELFKDEAEKLKEKYGEASSKYQNHLFNDVYTDEMKRAQRSVESIEESIRYRKEKIAELEKTLKDKQVEVDELPKKFPRHFYTVDIPDDTGENYLDWANALTDGQIERIRQYLVENYRRNKVEDFDASIAEVNAWTRRGENVYKTLTSLLGTDKEVSKALSEMGFAGIKYPTDYQRGGREDGAKNYVIFNENDAKITDHVRFFKTKNGEAYGFTVGGKIYIDPKIANTETPIHEYAHLWAAALRGQNPKEWRNIVELMKGTSVWDEVKKRYPELNTDDDIADEVLATYSGRRGAERLREEQRKIAGGKGGVFEKAEAISALERVKQALRKFWKSVADFLHIHYKSAEEVADRVMKDLLDGTDPGKHFDSRKSAPRFQFIGEKGAARADRGEEALTRQNNLDVARKMEAAKKDAKAIKLATGWERGADGKWRYDIPDGIYHPKGGAELKKALAKQPWGEELNGLSDRILDGEELSKEETERFNELAEKEAAFKADYLKKEKPHLADWLENDELFKAYPELKRVGIVFTDNMPKEQAGYYDSKSNTITVNTNSSEDTASIIAHEVQHAIQRYEGFATGGNLKAAMEYLSGNKRADVKIKQQLAYKLSQEKGLGLSEEEVNSLIGHLEYEDISDDELQKQIDALCQKHNITEDQLEDIYPMDSVWHEAYNRISGEAEARNVQKRMGMTAEERRASLAADTEDVARDSQILLFDDTGKNMRMESWDTDKEEVNIVEATHEHGFKNYADAKQWAKENIAGTYTDAETGGKGEIRISNTAIDKFLSESATAKSENRDAHMSTLRVLPDVIRESIDAEQHPDFKKGVDGKRSAENGVNSDVMIHRLYGAIRIGDDIYRVKVTLKENRRTKETTKAYSYETTKIELLAGQHGDVTMTSPRNSNNSISVANLLKDVEKSDGGGKILSEDNSEENKIIAEAKKNGRYMPAPNGKKSNLNERQWAQVRTKAFKNWFGDWENDPENSSKVVDENGEPQVVDGLFLNLKESPLPKMKKAFLRAKELAEMGRKAEKDSGYQIDSSEFAYSEEGDAFLEEYMRSSGSVQSLCDCLLKGYTPKPVVAFRYGEIRGNQRSYNYRDNIFEKGVSVVGKVSEMNTKKSGYYDAFWGNGENYNIVIGYDIGERGADGEMLLTKANVIGKAKDMACIVKSATENSGKFSNEEDDIRYRMGEKKELRDGRKIEFVRKPTATYNALARHLQAEGIKPDMHEARTGSRYMSFEKDGVQWEVRSSDHTKPEYFGEAQKPVELTYYKDKQGEENLSVSVDLGTSGYNIEDMKALMAEIDRLKNDAGEVKESFDKGVVSDEAAKRYPLLSQALGVKSENEVRAEEEAREHAEEARKQEMRSAVEDMAGKLHLNNVDIVDKPAERGAGRRERAKGMFERSTGRITINTGNCADKRDAVVTLLHEAVAHHGLRKLFGENFETFLDNVYNSANAEIRRIIDKHSRRYGGDKRTATEEYMASLAERTGFENAKKSGWWQRIKDFFLKMLEKIGLKGFKGEDLSDNELRYVLWRSYENLKSGGKDTVFSAADDLAKQSELNVGEFAPDAKKTAPEENAEEVNERFNNELTRYQNGEMDKNEMLHLGRPQGVMRTFLPNLPIVMRQRVIKKGSEKKHEVDVSAIMNMPQHLSSPIFVFQRSEDTIGVLTDMRDRNGKNVCVAIELKRQIQQGAEYLEVNDVRSFHGREFKNIVEPIANNKALKWVDKEKGLAYLSSASQPVQQEIDKQVLDTATKVVENFENPKSESENDALFRDGDAKDYEKAQARETYERRVSTGMFQSREAIQDSMLSLKVAMDAIEEATSGKAKRIEDYDGFENAYLGENRLSSVNQAESAAFAHLLIRPMMEEVNRLAPTAKDRAELIDYMFAKHGLERNAYMRQQAAEKKLAEYKKQNPGTAKTAADFIDAERDYAGLTTLTGKADVSAAEAEAQRMVAEYEKTTHFMEFGMRYMYVERKSVR